MRTRDWRRFKEEVKVIYRIKKICSNRYRVMDANGNSMRQYKWMDIIGTQEHYMFKTYTTKYSGWKEKYGKKSSGYRKIGNRQTNKIRFKKMLEIDYGIKHLNVSYGFMEDNTGE
jgi:hypothetical protein